MSDSDLFIILDDDFTRPNTPGEQEAYAALFKKRAKTKPNRTKGHRYLMRRAIVWIRAMANDHGTMVRRLVDRISRQTRKA